MEPTAAEARLLRCLAKAGEASVEAATEAAGFTAVAQTLTAAERLVEAGWVRLEQDLRETWRLTPEGMRYKASGVPERRALRAVQDSGGRLSMAALATHLADGEVPVAVGWLKRKGWGQVVKAPDGPVVEALTEDPPPSPDEEAVAILDEEPQESQHPGLSILAGRGGIVERAERVERRLALTAEGRAAAATVGDIGEDVTQVTPELVARWADMDAPERARTRLRPFDIAADVAPRFAAKPHPLSQLMAQVRRIFWQMGFSEIRGDYVESAFWNMDALFIPQDHPAREQQDTFYLAHPERLDVAADELDRVAAVHEHGGSTGSTGWGGAFSRDVAQRALLRTHTTNTTVRYLAEAFRAGPSDTPHRVFGLGRVFRNETMDATHLPEFHQIEGILTEPGASFDMLVGLARHFFAELGFPQVRFRPAYFPYTEPSMEIEVHYHGRWMELGGCGVFRPEVTEPIGVPHPVLAWGFGLERLAMMRLGIKDIRQLYVPDLEWLRSHTLL